MSLVLEWTTVTVAFLYHTNKKVHDFLGETWMKRRAAGRPTILDLPITQTFFPSISTPILSNNSTLPYHQSDQHTTNSNLGSASDVEIHIGERFEGLPLPLGVGANQRNV